MLEAPLAEALREGVLPVLDPHRSGGQPLLGNPNAVPLYPDNLLFLAAPLLWALNAHFWLHWLMAPLAAYWLARAWGLGRPAAWAAGVCYGVSGYFLSQLNLYNLVAGAALVPALVAAVLRCGEGDPAAERRRGGRAAAAAGVLWALVLLSGDPVTAVLGASLAASAATVRWRRRLLRPIVVGRLAAAVGLGTLVALPQIVEFLRILPATYRGYWGYAAWRHTVGAWSPAHAIEWLVPQAFGRYDLWGAGGFWAQPLFDGNLPFFLSLYPGILALALVLAAGRPRGGAAWWAWGSVVAGLFLSAGGTHPLGRWLFELPGAEAFRYPVKLWMAVAVGAALLCGLGWQRTFGAGDGAPALPGAAALRRLAWPLAAIAALLGGVTAFLIAAPGAFDGLVFRFARPEWTAELVAAERARWLATLVVLFAVLLALGLGLVLARRRPVAGAALLLAVHAAAQVHLLRGLLVTDEAAYYREPPAALAAIPPGSRVAHAQFLDLFGPSPLHLGPDHRFVWAIRQDFASLIPGAGIVHGDLRYELGRTPEGLESFLSRIAYEAVFGGPTDADRVRGLARWGVEYVISEEPLEEVPGELTREVATFPGVTAPVRVYRLAGAAPEALFAETELRVPHLNAAWDLFRSPGFDPDRLVVLPGDPEGAVPALPAAADGEGAGEGPGQGADRGRVRVLARGPESLTLETASPVAGVVVVQRSLLPVWRATVDGAPAELEPANLYRIGVRVPAGEHRLRLWVDRSPLRWSLAGSAAGLAGLAALALLGGRRRAAGQPGGAPPETPEPAPAADSMPGS
jgi:hypothetical protein